MKYNPETDRYEIAIKDFKAIDPASSLAFKKGTKSPKESIWASIRGYVDELKVNDEGYCLEGFETKTQAKRAGAALVDEAKKRNKGYIIRTKIRPDNGTGKWTLALKKIVTSNGLLASVKPDNQYEKRCKGCGEVKPIGDFNRNGYDRQGQRRYRPTCNTCGRDTRKKAESILPPSNDNHSPVAQSSFLVPSTVHIFDRIKFDETYHSYILDGHRLKSVTSLVSQEFVPEFDRLGIATKKSKESGIPIEEILTKWDTNGKTARSKGSEVHKAIKNFFSIGDWNEVTQTVPELSAFKKWMEYNRNLKPFKFEWIIGDVSWSVGGTIDVVFEDLDDGKFFIVDWKTNREFKVSNIYENLKFPFNNYENCQLTEASLQVNLYHLILSNNTDLPLKMGKIVHLSEGGIPVNYYAIDYQDRLREWLNENRVKLETLRY